MTRKRKVGGQPKTSTSGGPSANKRKRTSPAKWIPYIQPRTTYMIGNKITPAWGLMHRGDMDLTEDWRVPLYTLPKLTEKQEAAQKEAPISAIRRLCLEIAYDFKQDISFQMHAYRLLQEAAEWYLVSLQRHQLTCCTCPKNPDQPKRYGTGKKSVWRLWTTQYLGMEF